VKKKTPLLEESLVGSSFQKFSPLGKVMFVANSKNSEWYNSRHNRGCDWDYLRDGACDWESSLHMETGKCRPNRGCEWENSLHMETGKCRPKRGCDWESSLHMGVGKYRPNRGCDWNYLRKWWGWKNARQVRVASGIVLGVVERKGNWKIQANMGLRVGCFKSSRADRELENTRQIRVASGIFQE
jgi:hypothetical protein